MNVPMKPLAEVTRQAIEILIARMVWLTPCALSGEYTTGRGDYTAERGDIVRACNTGASHRQYQSDGKTWNLAMVW